MQTLQQRAAHYSTYFTTKTRASGETFEVLADDAPQELQNAVRDAHGDKFPSDWIYRTFADLLGRVEEYDAQDVEELRDKGYDHEIVDGYVVDVYPHELLQWLASDIHNLEYLEGVMADHCFVKDDGAWRVLARAQYYAIDAVMQHVLSLLDNDN